MTVKYMPHTTILMCTFQGQKYITQQLKSFSAQNHAKVGLWVSDDGSTDGTLEALRGFRSPDGHPPRILSGPQQGFAANFLSLLCAEDLPPGYVALSDQDDVWFPEKLSRALALLAPLDPRARRWPAGARC